MPRPPDMQCGSCGERLVPTRGRYVKLDYRRYDPRAWNTNYVHAGPMLDRHGAYPVEIWEES